MHRAQCEVTDLKEIHRILSTARIGRLATLDAEGYPYVTPVNYVLHEGSIFFHSAPHGEKLANMARDPRVCFEVDIPLAYLEVRFNPEENPCRAHQLYHSVVVRGKARVVPDGELKTQVLNALLIKHEGNADFRPVTAESPGYRKCCVVEVKAERTTAKSDLAQSSFQKGYRDFIVKRLEGRKLPGDVETLRAMGYVHEAKATEDS